jgi:hypothetical protein
MSYNLTATAIADIVAAASIRPLTYINLVEFRLSIYTDRYSDGRVKLGASMCAEGRT